VVAPQPNPASEAEEEAPVVTAEAVHAAEEQPQPKADSEKKDGAFALEEDDKWTVKMTNINVWKIETRADCCFCLSVNYINTILKLYKFASISTIGLELYGVKRNERTNDFS